MGRTRNLKMALKSTLTEVHPAIYHMNMRMMGKPTGLYATYSVEELGYTDGEYLATLEVNCIDHGTDTEACDQLADEIQEALDHQVIITDEIAIKVYIDRREPVEEEDSRVIRQRLFFQLGYYERR